ncbi:MAG: hypothetical protein M4D80_18880 [Myxococcota bacterium]|nr:hypothetical protein [Deltaproteobacteria bacterium]MDQ3337233.1 hypothetical protein [Myxococcota bacterium]
MLRKHASLIVAFLLIMLVVGACVVRTGRPVHRRSGGPVYTEKHKQQKHKKHKKPKKWKD